MRLSELLKPQNIKLGLEANTKSDAIAELVKPAGRKRGRGRSEEGPGRGAGREATRTTGIGNGLAIPHGKCTGTDHLVMAVGKAREAIDFQAIDGRPVVWIWLLSSPPDKTGPHIHALARISRLMTIDKFRQALAEPRRRKRSLTLSARRRMRCSRGRGVRDRALAICGCGCVIEGERGSAWLCCNHGTGAAARR